MSSEQWSAALSLLAAIVVVAASFRQWVVVTVDGDLPLRPWAKVMLAAVLVLLVALAVALVVSLVG
ncbi:MAG: hypothetical protein ABJB55_10225 [Actinomycetota bacterium]